MTEILYFLLGLTISAIGGASVGYLLAKKRQRSMSDLIEALFQEFKNMGFNKEDAEKLAHHTREIMEICNVSKSDAIRGIVEMLK